MGTEQRYQRVRRFIEEMDLPQGMEARRLTTAETLLKPHVRVQTGTTADSTGYTYIIDLGREGSDIFQQVFDFVAHIADYRNGRMFAARMIHETIVTRVVRELNRPPAEALDILQYFPHRNDVLDLFRMVKLHEPDVFTHLLKGSGIALYRKIRPQLQVKLNVQYAACQVGRDFVLIREVVFPFPGRLA